MNQDNGGPAFPGPVMKPLENYYPGLTLRDYFAASVTQTMVLRHPNYSEAAKHAYAIADAMLKARK